MNRVDDVLPLSQPMHCVDGKLRSEISVSKGTVVIIDIASSNRRKDVWGEDADMFNPERWLVEQNPVPFVRTPGVVYGSVLNFVAGSKSSISTTVIQIFTKKFQRTRPNLSWVCRRYACAPHLI